MARLADTRYRHTSGQAAALSPDGLLLALTTRSAVTVYDLDTGLPAYRLAGPDTALFTADGKHLLTIDGSGPIRVWHAANGKPVRALLPPERKAIPALAGEAGYKGRVTALLGRFPSLRSRLRVEAEKAESAEVRARLERILTGANPVHPGPADLRRARVLAAVELAATPAARSLLQAWARGNPASPLTIEAKAALERLNRR